MDEKNVPRIGKRDPNKKRKKSFKVSKPEGNINVTHKWTVTVTLLAFFLSIIFGIVTSVMSRLNIISALIILLCIISVSVVFDMLGTAVGAAEEFPFHSLAARKVRGAAHSVRILRNAPQVASLCNDVIGDIAGIISGSSTAVIVANISMGEGGGNVLISLVLTAVVAALTIGGKAFCKGIAMKNANAVVFFMGRIFYDLEFIAHLGKSKR
ncbi:MAG: hypothetical protein J1F64_04000 [Oscillospiraceae bacterium]|nr:hypothetical protein [Oscillospiraceae bacterium]